MAPRIRNISPDEFRRLFQAPEIAKPGITVSDAISLQQALEQKRTNELKQQQQIAEIERKIAEAEAKARDIQTLSTQKAQPVEQRARAAIDPSQEGIEEGPLTQEDQAVIDQAREVAAAQLRLGDPEEIVQQQIEATEPISREAAEELDLPEGTPREDIEAILKQRKIESQEKLAEQKATAQKKKSSIDLTKEAGKIVNLKTQAQGLSNLLDRIPSIPGLGAASRVTRGRSFFGLGGEALSAAKQYINQVPTVAVSAYRTISQDQRINNEDARDRALPLFPEVGEPPNVRADKLLFIDEMLNNARQINAAQQQNLINPESAAEKFLALENRLLLRTQAIKEIQLENKRRQADGQRPLKLTNDNIKQMEAQLVERLGE